MHLLCKLSANIFGALHTIEQTECKLYFRFTARRRLRLPRGFTALIWQPLEPRPASPLPALRAERRGELAASAAAAGARAGDAATVSLEVPSLGGDAAAAAGGGGDAAEGGGDAAGGGGDASVEGRASTSAC